MTTSLEGQSRPCQNLVLAPFKWDRRVRPATTRQHRSGLIGQFGYVQRDGRGRKSREVQRNNNMHRNHGREQAERRGLLRPMWCPYFS
jgi:hypothetical protein